MEFCKTIKEFDCTKFEEGQLYYIHWHDINNQAIKAIYLCDRIDKENNSVKVVRIVPMSGKCPAHILVFEPKDVYCIDEVQIVEFEANYDISWRKWFVKATVDPEIKEVKNIYAYCEE